MPLPLLALGALAGLPAAQKWIWQTKQDIQRAGQAADREDYAKRYAELKGDLDPSTESGLAQLTARMMGQQDMAPTASSMLNASMGRTQNQSQYDNSFNNISAAQQQQGELQRQQMGQQASYQNAMLDMQRQQMEYEQNYKMQALKRQGMWTPQEMQTEQASASKGVADAVAPFESSLPAYQQVTSLLNNSVSNPVAKGAALTSFVKLLDPTSVVSLNERGAVLKDTSLGSGFTQAFNDYMGSGMSEENRQKMQNAVNDVMRGRAKSAQSALERSRSAFAATPFRPALDFDAAAGKYNSDFFNVVPEESLPPAFNPQLLEEADAAFKNRPPPNKGSSWGASELNEKTRIRGKR